MSDDTKALFERVRAGMECPRCGSSIDGLAALSELKEQLEAAERNYTTRNTDCQVLENAANAFLRRAEAAERERDSYRKTAESLRERWDSETDRAITAERERDAILAFLVVLVDDEWGKQTPPYTGDFAPMNQWVKP